MLLRECRGVLGAGSVTTGVLSGGWFCSGEVCFLLTGLDGAALFRHFCLDSGEA